MKLKNLFFNLLFTLQAITATTQAQVIPSTNLCPQEVAFTQARYPFTQNAIEQMVGYPCNTMPTIALCLSGGGYRSMISCLGFLIGAQQIGLLDASQYIAGLSGGTWLLGPLLAHNQQTPSSAAYLQQYRTWLQQVVSRNFLAGLNIPAIEAALIEKHFVQGQPLQFVDVWGAILANTLMGDLAGTGQSVRFSQCFPAPAGFPFPLCTAVIAPNDQPPYQWIEVSPFYVASDYLGAQVPTPLFGNRFSNGVAETNWPEQSLGYFLGIFGSPYAIAPGDVLYQIAVDIKNPILRAALIALAQWHDLYPDRFVPATPPNYTYQLAGSPLADATRTTIIDGGFYFNLPTVALLNPQRAVDIIFICDASSDASIATNPPPPQLHLAATYAQQHGLKFPSVTTPIFANANLLIFKDPSDPTIPTVVYIPNLIQESTLKLQYSPAEFDALCSYMTSAVVANQASIVNVIKERTTPAQDEPVIGTVVQPDDEVPGCWDGVTGFFRRHFGQ